MDILTQSTPTHIEQSFNTILSPINSKELVINKDISSLSTLKQNQLSPCSESSGVKSTIISHEELLMAGLIQFFSKPYNLNQLLPILDGTSPLPLRVLDWFVTNYSKQYDIIYSIKKGDQIRQFAVHNHYKAQLKGYSKRQFDPFCRRKRVYLEFGVNQEIETTVGQLNFFKWAIENKVLDYVQNNLKLIIDDMNARGSKAKKIKSDGITPITKKELSVSATKSITKHDVIVTVKFN